VPVLGICFGAQALAAALGGQAIRAERPEVGWTPIQTHRPDLIEPGPWFQWHSDRWVLPDGGRRQARALGLDPDQLTAETAARSGEGRLRAKRLVSAFLALAGSA
jgi:hypothetical protein